jgi:glycerol-3-phosphate acyltransferase PlsY
MDWSDYAIWAAALVVGYLLGSIPFGLILTRYAGLGDIRNIGSGNIGATNVLRTGRKGLAAATLLLDALKGVAAVLIASLISKEAGLAAACGAFLGHLFPVWLGFRGGKGVATYLGTLFAVFWPVGLIFAGIWLAAAFLSRRSSVGALTASLAAPIALFLFRENAAGWLYAAMTVLLWWRHRENIRRLLAGTEASIGGKK